MPLRRRTAARLTLVCAGSIRDRPAAGEGQPWHRIFVRHSVAQTCLDTARVHVLGHANRLEWWLFQADALPPGCQLRGAIASTPTDDEN